MVEPRSKKEKLSETTKSYLLELWIEEVWGRKIEFSNKYTEKGILCEEDSLDIASDHYKRFLLKNKERYTNDFICGTPDVILEDVVIDIKSSWDMKTFMQADGKNKDYYWQLQGYMDLLSFDNSELAYCLSDAPEHLIVSEKNNIFYNKGLDPQTEEYMVLEAQVEKNMMFDDVPKNKRIKTFQFTKNTKDLERLYSRIIDAREYLGTLSL